VVTAGLPRKPGMSRMDLLETNATIVRGISENIAKYAPSAVVIVVSNPLDEMTTLAQLATGFGHERVLGQAGMLGAIAAGARLRGLDAAGIGTAIRIGGNLMVTAGYGNVVAGATTLNAVGGMSAMAAVNAPELVLAGFTAQDDAIEQTMTELLSVGFNPTPVFDGLGARWEIAQVLFRLRACCNPIYPALDALADVLARLQPRAEDIERIDVETYDFAAGLGVQEPPGHFGARYSLPHAAAALVVNGHLGYASFTDAAVRDPVLTALRHRVHVVEDKAMTARLPASKPARVTLVLKDGRREAASVEDDRRVGEAFDEAPVRAKMRFPTMTHCGTLQTKKCFVTTHLSPWHAK
jgi:2-methylcitrate dehydratase PrpD